MKKTVSVILAAGMFILLISANVSAQCRVRFLNYQKMALYYSQSDNKYYLAVYSMDDSVKLSSLGTDNLHVMFKLKSNEKITIDRKDLIVINIGDMFYQKAAQYTFFKFNLIIDHSGSIDDASLNNTQKILKKFIDSIPLCLEAQIIKFSNQHWKSRFTKSKDELKKYIDDPYERGGTALNDSIALGVQELKTSGGDAFKFSIILTDGKDTASSRYKDPVVFKNYIVSECRQNQIPLFIVGVTKDVDEPLLKEISKFGFYQHVNDFPDIDKAFKVIENIIRKTYLFKLPAAAKLSEVEQILIVKKTLSGYETIQDICVE